MIRSFKYLILILTFIIALSPQPARAEDNLKNIWVASFMLMTEQFTTTMMHQVQIIGTFFDAKHQLETQRLFQQKVARAHKDYHPSEQMCEIGTFIRNLNRTDERIKINRNAIQNASIARALGSGAVKTMDDQGSGSDERTRRTEFINKYCNVQDNAAQNLLLCETSKHVAQQNADLNYTQTIDHPLTLNAIFDDGVVTREEENIFAFLDQIFMNNSFTDVARDETVLHNFIKPYQEMRSLIAMRSVAQNSFAHIIGEKAAAFVGDDDAETEDGDITPFLRSLLIEIGIPEEFALPGGEIIRPLDEYLGENPSYYAQMEILTKKMLQNPKFISDLYDKPANVKRIRASLTAIKLMQDRDIHSAMQRREMLTSMILELQLRYKQRLLSNEIEDIIAVNPKVPDTLIVGADPDEVEEEIIEGEEEEAEESEEDATTTPESEEEETTGDGEGEIIPTEEEPTF